MFTGLVSHVGELMRVVVTAEGRALTMTAPWDDIAEGESIAVDGVCLTVVQATRGSQSLRRGAAGDRLAQFTVSAVGTTLARTTIGHWRAGRRVNLERALRVGDRLGGHIVQGHVDGVAEVTRAHLVGDAWMLDLALWDGVEGLMVPQGSVTIDGVSLTVHTLGAAHELGVSIVDYTRGHTTLGEKQAGDQVNVELDVIGKYVKQLAGPWQSAVAGIR